MREREWKSPIQEVRGSTMEDAEEAEPQFEKSGTTLTGFHGTGASSPG